MNNLIRTALQAVLVVLGTLSGHVALATPLAAQPATDIFLADLSLRDGRAVLGPPVNVTARPGYDNQPAFERDGGALLYTSIRADSQADIYRYDFGTREVRRLTSTPESEYSPTPMRAGGFSVVRVEADSTQRLWRFDDTGSDMELVLTDVRPVGYHAWADERHVALFVLGSPPTLQLADVRTGTATVLAEDIGRSLQPILGRAAISFVQRVEDGRDFLVELDVTTRRLRTLIELPAGAEYHVWLPDGSVLTTSGGRILQWRSHLERRWQVIADHTARGISFTRLAVSPAGDRLALVGEATGVAQ